MSITLYRAHREAPWLGHRSWWAADREHAHRYLTMLGFGGPILYRVKVEPRSVLRLGAQPWPVLADEFGLDRADYSAGESDHALIGALSRLLASGGYDWAVLAVEHPSGWHDEWLYLDEATLAAEPDPIP